MSQPLVITLPADDDRLRHEIEQQLGQYAEVQTAPSAFGINETMLMVEAIVGTAAGVAQIIQVLLELRDRYQQQGRKSEIRVGKLDQSSIPLEEADEALLRRLLTDSDE